MSGPKVNVLSRIVANSPNQLLNTTSSPTFAGLSINGNLTVTGSTTIISSDVIEAKDALLLINFGQTGTPSSGLISGFEVDRGSGTNYQMIYRESDQSARAGFTGATQAIAFREDTPIDHGLAMWNAATNRFITVNSGVLPPAGDGSVGAPSFTFASDTTIGMYKPAPAQLGFTVEGVLQLLLTTTSAVLSQATTITTGGLSLTGATSGTPTATLGSNILSNTSTFNDATTGIGGTASAMSYNVFRTPTLTSTNTGVITTDASTVYIENAPSAGSNETITNAWALLVASGKSKFGGAILGANGTVALPEFAFSGDTDTGMYSTGVADQLAFATNGVQQLLLTTSAIVIAQQIQNASGTVGAPAYAFTSNLTSGLYSIGVNDIAMAVGGVKQVEYTTSALIVAQQIQGANGTVGAPEYAFTNNLTSGLYSIGVNDIAMAVGGVKQVEYTTSALIVAQQIQGANGTVGAPEYAFTNNLTSGLYSIGVNDIAMAVGGVKQVEYTTSALIVAQQIQGANGTVGAPAYAFTSNLTSGLYSIGVNDIAVAVGGVKQLELTTSALVVAQQVQGANGTVGAPEYAFTNNLTSGMYSIGVNDIAVAVNGVKQLELTTSALVVAQQVQNASGTVGAPAYAFTSNLTSGMYSIGVNDIAIAVNGVKQLELTTSALVVAQQVQNASGTVGAPAYAFTSNLTSGLYSIGVNDIAVAVNGVKQLELTTSALVVAQQVQNASGTVGAPAYAFTSNLTSGMYSIGVNDIAIAVNGVKQLELTTTTATFAQQLLGQNGTVSLPAYSFTNDTDTGMYYTNVADQLAFATNGVQQLLLTTTTATFAQQLLGQNGTVSLPAYSFTNDTDTGMYYTNVADQLAFATNGVQQLLLTTTTATFAQQILAPNGTVSLPSHSFTNDTDTGMYYTNVADQLAFATNGVQQMLLTTSSTTIAQQILGQNGTVSLPAYSFTNDSDTGMYYTNTADQLAFATNGVQQMLLTTTSTTIAQQILAQNGTVSLPAYSFTNDPDTGMYYTNVADNLAFAVNGSQQLLITPTAVTVASALTTLNGLTSGTPTAAGTTFSIGGTVFQDTATGNGGTAAFQIFNAIQAPTLSASHTTVTTSFASTVYIAGAPIVGTNETITNNYALWIGAGISNFGGQLIAAGGVATPSNVAGSSFLSNSTTYTDTTTAASGTASAMSINVFRIPTIAATNTNVTTTDASTFYIEGAPVAGSHETITNTWSLNVAGGKSKFGGAILGASATVGNPEYSFSSDATGGLYLAAGNRPALSSGGAEIFEAAATFLVMKQQFVITNGTVSSPGFAFTADQTTGIYTSGASDMAFSVGSTNRMEMTSATGVVITGTVSATPSATLGSGIKSDTATFTDTATGSGGTATAMSFNVFRQPTIASNTTNVTTTTAATVYIENAPTNGTGENAITNPWALQIANGKTIMQATTDTTAANTGVFQNKGGIYAAGGIWSDKQMTSSPWQYAGKGTTSLAKTSTTLAITSLPAYDVYRVFIYLRALLGSNTAIYLRQLMENSTANNYNTLYQPGTTTAQNTILTTTHGFWIYSTNNNKEDAMIVYDVAGIAATSTSMKLTPVSSTWESGSNTNVLHGGFWQNTTVTNQITRLDFELYSSFNGATRLSAQANDDITLKVIVYGASYGNNGFT